jgi:hypothetical protein
VFFWESSGAEGTEVRHAVVPAWGAAEWLVCCLWVAMLRQCGGIVKLLLARSAWCEKVFSVPYICM